jgi:hypothetical protein
VAEGFDVDSMIERFRERAHAVRERPLPPIAGEERTHFIRQAQLDYQDFAMIGDAQGTIEDGWLVLRVDLRPPQQATGSAATAGDAAKAKDGGTSSAPT